MMSDSDDLSNTVKVSMAEEIPNIDLIVWDDGVTGGREGHFQHHPTCLR